MIFFPLGGKYKVLYSQLTSRYEVSNGESMRFFRMNSATIYSYNIWFLSNTTEWNSFSFVFCKASISKYMEKKVPRILTSRDTICAEQLAVRVKWGASPRNECIGSFIKRINGLLLESLLIVSDTACWWVNGFHH